MTVVAGAITNTVGINNADQVDRTLALRVYAGEVTRAFRRKNIMAALQMRKDMRYGKSSQFPASGRLQASFHVKGNNVLTGTAGEAGTLTQLNMVERLVHIDNILVAGSFVSELDERLEHYDSRSTVADESGGGLGFYYDGLSIRQLARCARTNETNDAAFIPADMGETSGDSTGIGGYVQNAWDTADNIVAGIEAGALILDTKYIPDDDRHTIVDPTAYWAAIDHDKTVSSDFSDAGANYAKGKLYWVAGTRLHKTNHIPSNFWDDDGSGGSSAAEAQPAGCVNDYYGDNRNLKSIVFHKSAIGTVWLMDVTLEMEHLIEYLGSPVIAKMLAGTGRLRAEAAVEINTQATQPTLDGSEA